MVFELRQNLKLSQQLIMTPQLQQAIKLLQLSRLELLDSIAQTLESNPLLEEVARGEEDQGESHERDEGDIALNGKPETATTREITGEGDGRDEFDWQNYFEDRVPAGFIHERRDTGEGPAWDNLVSRKPSLVEHLMWQLRLSRFTDEEILIAEQIIGNLDSDGYLRETLESISRETGCAEALVESVLKKIQLFDPPGVGARNLQECLLIQLDALADESLVVRAIIRDHLKNLESKNYSLIAKKLSLPMEDVLQAIELIKSLDPKPGGVYNEERIETIIPDVYIVKVGTEYRVFTNDDHLPHLRVNNQYRSILESRRNASLPDSEKRFVRENLQAANWFLKSLQQRQRTICRVAESIIRVQRDFFDKGISCLRPLVLKEVADDVQMHESTISRVVTNKYMQTPNGIFELRFFFGSSIQTTKGDPVSSRSVKEKIRKVVAEEDPGEPRHDRDIAAILKSQGISIARRTVAKYRESMKILPAAKRKKYL